MGLLQIDVTQKEHITVLSDFTELKNMQDQSLGACTVCTISQKPLTIEWFFFFYVGHAAS